MAPGTDTQVEVTLTPGATAQGLSSTLTVTSNDAYNGVEVVFLAARIFIPFSDEGTLWFLGIDDDAQDGEGDTVFNDPAFFNGVDFFVSGVRESGETPLPGNPDNQGGASGDAGRDIDDDYYFAGVYDIVVDGEFPLHVLGQDKLVGTSTHTKQRVVPRQPGRDHPERPPSPGQEPR